MLLASRRYRVLIVIKGGWWSDQVELPSFAAAQRHRNDVAARWNDCDTAIAAPDGRVLAYMDSLIEQGIFAEVRAEQARERLALEQAPASTSRASRASTLNSGLSPSCGDRAGASAPISAAPTSRASRASAFPSPSVPTKISG